MRMHPKPRMSNNTHKPNANFQTEAGQRRKCSSNILIQREILKDLYNCRIKITQNNKLLSKFLRNVQIHALNQNDPEIKLELKRATENR
uniref:Uncharacterized protein n=1 Tax=Cucumis melo TaxID=3656 RepID=A0A9I9EAA2_CUCME